MKDALKILMLEDNSADAHLVERLLRKDKMEFAFEVAADKDVFLKSLNEFKPDIILLDNSLPKFSATEALKIVKQRSRHIPCILLTGTVSEEFAAGIMKLGADDYILKDRIGRLPAAIEVAIKCQRIEKEKDAALVELRLSEENHRALVERVSDPFIAIDTNWNFIFVNKKAGKIFNRNPEELINKHVWTEFPNGLGKQSYEIYHEAMEKQQNILIEEYSEVYDKWFENQLYSSRSGISIFIRDITLRKKAEEKLQSAHDRLCFHLDNSPLAFIEWDTALKPRFWSRRAEEIFGWSEKEIISSNCDWFSKVYEEDLSNLKDMVKELVDGKVVKNRLRCRNYTKSGHIIWCEWFNSILKNSDDEIITILSLVQDITQTKEAEANLERSKIGLKEA